MTERSRLVHAPPSRCSAGHRAAWPRRPCTGKNLDFSQVGPQPYTFTLLFPATPPRSDYPSSVVSCLRILLSFGPCLLSSVNLPDCSPQGFCIHSSFCLRDSIYLFHLSHLGLIINTALPRSGLPQLWTPD